MSQPSVPFTPLFDRRPAKPPVDLAAVKAAKVAAWRAQGYDAGMIDAGVNWAERWSRRMSNKFGQDPGMREQIRRGIYAEAFDLAENYMKAMLK